MGDVFILKDYGKLSRQNDHFLYTDCNGNTKKILPFKTDMIVLAGKVSLTADCLQLLAQNKISVYFFGFGKNENGRIEYGPGKNVFLRQAQYHLIGSSAALEIAKTIVKGKINNQKKFLRHQKKYFPSDLMDFSCKKLKMISNCLENAASLDTIRGFEGLAARYYFEAFNTMLIPDWAEFGKREQHPAKTNVNCVLNFIYTVLMYRVQRALESFGLDTMVSNLHELSYGKDSLAFDMMEEFRTPFADSLCIKLFNKGILQKKDFYENGGILFTEEGKEKVISNIEGKLVSKVYSKRLNENKTYSDMIFEQAHLYKKFILGEIKDYIPFEI